MAIPDISCHVSQICSITATSSLLRSWRILGLPSRILRRRRATCTSGLVQAGPLVPVDDLVAQNAGVT